MGAFKRYNIRDVEAEISIQAPAKFQCRILSGRIHIDQEINDRGVAIDRPLVSQAIDLFARSRS